MRGLANWNVHSGMEKAAAQRDPRPTWRPKVPQRTWSLLAILQPSRLPALRRRSWAPFAVFSFGSGSFISKHLCGPWLPRFP